MVPAFIIGACGGLMILCGAFVQRRGIIVLVALLGTITMGFICNALTLLEVFGPAVGYVSPEMFVSATCTLGAVAVIAVYFTIAAFRGKLSKTACLISWAVASWFVGFSYLIIGAVYFFDTVAKQVA